MTDSEKMDVLLSEMTALREGQQKLEKGQYRLEAGQQRLEGRQERLEAGQQTLKKSQQKLEENQKIMQGDLFSMKVHMENSTDWNLQLLAENYGNLAEKLSKNNIVTDQQAIYQIKVNYLIEDVKELKKEMKELRDKVAQKDLRAAQ